ncbi:hypothetical protein D9758_000108 [Tetrapyrgos nigripes]|uniref:ATP synthase mitochondrial F1 complex assembly factor 1 n=1 Tax=Tetrapyrgos nigripes TaxID=182062 RepID=A0A8H5LZI0_9AGAR|nr:hypothetical protein D9758_000108 [Tetrapyrgos nigripes]
MYRNVLLRSSQRFASFRHLPARGLPSLSRGLHELHESKYADRLRQRAEEKGLSVDDLKLKAKEQQEAESKRLREAHDARIAKEKEEKEKAAEASDSSRVGPKPSARKDNSPIKPLSSILNLPRILSVSPGQVSALWTAYHASRSEGTGRGYLCATIPVELYEKMTAVGAKYPSFVLPVPRPQKNPDTPQGEQSQEEMAHEFYYMEWGFHGAPKVPSASEPDTFTAKPQSPEEDSANPQISTVLFTSLQEYKMRISFATPYLVLTHYTDLVKTHGIVLLRGEITPSSSGQGYLLSQEDAQILSMGVQKFYLWDDKKGDDYSESKGEKFLKAFHENPDSFQWNDMLEYGTQTS